MADTRLWTATDTVRLRKEEKTYKKRRSRSMTQAEPHSVSPLSSSVSPPLYFEAMSPFYLSDEAFPYQSAIMVDPKGQPKPSLVIPKPPDQLIISYKTQKRPEVEIKYCRSSGSLCFERMHAFERPFLSRQRPSLPISASASRSVYFCV
jgi:hypothetical protein